MKEFYFDTEARIRFWCDAETKLEAIEMFAQSVRDAKGLKIDVGTYEPDTTKEKTAKIMSAFDELMDALKPRGINNAK